MNIALICAYIEPFVLKLQAYFGNVFPLHLNPLDSFWSFSSFKVPQGYDVICKKVNQTKIKGGCQSGRKVVPHDNNSKSDLPLNTQTESLDRSRPFVKLSILRLT